jgi:hypothetical protein
MPAPRSVGVLNLDVQQALKSSVRNLRRLQMLLAVYVVSAELGVVCVL